MQYHQHHDSDYFIFTNTATTEIYTLSLHDALPIFGSAVKGDLDFLKSKLKGEISVTSRTAADDKWVVAVDRSEEHTSELQSRLHLVCRLLLEKKNRKSLQRALRRFRKILFLPCDSS